MCDGPQDERYFLSDVGLGIFSRDIAHTDVLQLVNGSNLQVSEKMQDIESTLDSSARFCVFLHFKKMDSMVLMMSSPTIQKTLKPLQSKTSAERQFGNLLG